MPERLQRPMLRRSRASRPRQSTSETLRPRAVIAGHKKPENDDSPRIINETRQYIRDFDRVADMTTAQEFTIRCWSSIRIEPNITTEDKTWHLSSLLSVPLTCVRSLCRLGDRSCPKSGCSMTGR